MTVFLRKGYRITIRKNRYSPKEKRSVLTKLGRNAFLVEDKKNKGFNLQSKSLPKIIIACCHDLKSIIFACCSKQYVKITSI